MVHALITLGIFLGLFLGLFGGGVASAKTATDDLIVQAKTLLTQGQRKQSIEILGKAALAAKSKATRAEILAKKIIFAEQFITSHSFQKYQEAKAEAETRNWEDCLKTIEAVSVPDQENTLVLSLRGKCQMQAKFYELAEKSFRQILSFFPDDVNTTFELVSISIRQKNYEKALSLLQGIQSIGNTMNIERFAILKAQALSLMGQKHQAIDVLKLDQESHLDHVEVLYELGSLYYNVGGFDWQARKMLLLFVARCKRFKESELKAKGYDAMLTQAQEMTTLLDRRLGI